MASAFICNETTKDRNGKLFLGDDVSPVRPHPWLTLRCVTTRLTVMKDTK